MTIAGPEVVREVTGFAPGRCAPFPLERVAGSSWSGAPPAPRRSGRARGRQQHLVALTPAELVRLSRGRIEDVVLESA